MTPPVTDCVRYFVTRLNIDPKAIEDLALEIADREIEAAMDDAHSGGGVPRLLANAAEEYLKDRACEGIKKWVSTLTS